MIFFIFAPAQVLQIFRLLVPTRILCVLFFSGDLLNKPRLIDMCRNDELTCTIVLYVKKRTI